MMKSSAYFVRRFSIGSELWQNNAFGLNNNEYYILLTTSKQWKAVVNELKIVKFPKTSISAKNEIY